MNEKTPSPKTSEPVRLWTAFIMALAKFNRIDGQHRAGAFAYFAFFSVFPLAILFVTIASAFIDQDHAVRQATYYIQGYIPLSSETQDYLAATIAGVVRARAKAGIIAFLSLIWVSAGFITTLLSAADRAWSIPQSSWWKLTIKGLLMLVFMIVALLLGIFVPIVNRIILKNLILSEQGYTLIFVLRKMLLPLVVSFASLAIFYKLAPQRPTRFSHIWLGALSATLMLAVVESLFVSYLTEYAVINAVYGTFGGIIALLLWVYISGCIIIYGACLCASQSDIEDKKALPEKAQNKLGSP